MSLKPAAIWRFFEAMIRTPILNETRPWSGERERERRRSTFPSRMAQAARRKGTRDRQTDAQHSTQPTRDDKLDQIARMKWRHGRERRRGQYALSNKHKLSAAVRTRNIEDGLKHKTGRRVVLIVVFLPITESSMCPLNKPRRSANWCLFARPTEVFSEVGGEQHQQASLVEANAKRI